MVSTQLFVNTKNGEHTMKKISFGLMLALCMSNAACLSKCGKSEEPAASMEEATGEEAQAGTEMENPAAEVEAPAAEAEAPTAETETLPATDTAVSEDV